MHEQITVDVLVNWVRMQRANTSGAIWICDSYEHARFFESRCVMQSASVMPAPTLAAEVSSELRVQGVRGVLATTSDPNKVHLPNAIFSEEGLSELFLNEASVTAVVTELGGATWVGAFRTAFGEDVKVALDSVSRQVCLLTHRCSVDQHEVISRIVASIRTTNRLPSRDVLVSIAASIAGAVHEDVIRETLINVDASVIHTEVGFAEIAIKLLVELLTHVKPHGLAVSTTVTAEAVWGLLRLTFALSSLEETRLFWHLINWEKVSGYKVLRDWRTLDVFGVVWDQRYWEKDLENLSRALSENTEIGLIKLDLDDFKQVNSALGHGGGDEALKLYLEIVRETIGHSALIYRRGGDEVIAVTLGIDFDGMKKLAEGLRAAIELRFRDWSNSKNLEVHPTASVGVVATSGTVAMVTLVTEVDAMQDRAKKDGKNRVVSSQVAA